MTPPDTPQPTHTLSLETPVAIGDGYTIAVENVVIETIEPSPDGAYPSGGAVEVNLLLERDLYQQRASLLEITDGYDPKLVAWLDNFRVSLVEVRDMELEPKVSLVIETVGDTLLPGPPQRHRLARGKSFELGDGDRVEFTGHSHKRTRQGQTSPLLVHLRWDSPGQEPATDTASLRPPKGLRTWAWRDLEFTLIDWDYDAWIEVDVRRFERRRVSGSASPR